MNPKRLLALASMILPIQLIFSQYKLLEKVEKTEDKFLIPYEKYVLDNGLIVVIHEDHSDPVVKVDVTYHVGSAREEIRKSGFAHFFEHMMFQGSDNVGDEQHFKIVTESGGNLNGTTNRDRTNYFETLPNNQLETALWLEADRMGFLLDAVTQKKFEIQRETVKNERGQNYDNRPYGRMSEVLSSHLYPYGHPYSWLTIGYLRDLNRVDVNDLKSFFLRWYGPNNAVLTVGGDVEPEKVLDLAVKYFGTIPRGPEVQNMAKMPAVVPADRYCSYEDKVNLPQLQMTFPSVEMYHDDGPALQCAAEMLGSGDNSLLYKNLVQTKIAMSAYAYQYPSELAGEFTIVCKPYPEKSLAEMEKAIRQTLSEFKTRGVNEADVERFINDTEFSMLRGLTSVSGKISTLAYYQTFGNDPGYTVKYLAKLRALKPADVVAAFEKYLVKGHAVILSCVPEGKKDLIAAPDNHTIDSLKYVFPPDQYSGLVYEKARDSFDRSNRPDAGANPVIQVPEFWKQDFANGIRIIGTQDNEIPLVSVQLTMDGGHRLEGSYPEKAGLSGLTAAMLNESSGKFTQKEFEDEMERLGGYISVFSGDDNTGVYLEILKKNLDEGLAMLEERLFHPRFAEDEFERVKKEKLENFNEDKTKPATIAANVFRKLLYQDGDIMQISPSGTPATVQFISLDDVREFYRNAYSPKVASIVISGDIGKDEILPKLGFLESWAGKEVKLPVAAASVRPVQTKIFLVDKKDAPQSQINIGYPAMAWDAEGEFYRATLMNYPLGGAFNSRINLNLREDKGYTYGARSRFSGSKYPGSFSASAGVRANVTDSAVAEFMMEIKMYHEKGVMEEELKFMRSSIGQREALDYETGQQKADFIGRLLRYDLDPGYVRRQNEILSGITREEINALARKYLDPAQMSILVVGDKKSVLPGLQKLGYEIVELDTDGNPVSGAGGSGGGSGGGQ